MTQAAISGYVELVSRVADVADLGVGIVNKVLSATAEVLGSTASEVVSTLTKVLGG